MNNKIIEVQEILFNEMKKLSNEDFYSLDNKETQKEFQKATALYNMSTNFIKTLNTNIGIMNAAKRNEEKYESLMDKLGLM